MRAAPKVWIGFAVVVGYMAVVLAVQATGGVPYTEWGDSAGNLFLGADLSLLIGTIGLAVVVTALGWWGPVLRERQRSRYRWPILAPLLLAAIAVVGLVGSDWSAVSGAFLGAALLLLLVGFTEEVAFRGVLLVALRSRMAEVWVWLISTAAFSASHLSNALLGQSFESTLPQVLATFFIGTVFYVLRRVTGSLIPAMLLHGLWDFSIFVQGNGTPSPITQFAGIALFPAALLGIVAVLFVVRDAHERIDAAQSSRASRLT